MNGRVYEPVAGRFLGIDPIRIVGISQDGNPYAYAWNNPLSIVDPSGFDELEYNEDAPGDSRAQCFINGCNFTSGAWGAIFNWRFTDTQYVPFRPELEWDGKLFRAMSVRFGAGGPGADSTEGGADPNLLNNTWLRFKLWWNTPKTIPWCDYNCAKVHGVETQIATTNGGDLMNAFGALSIAAGPLSAAGSASANAARGAAPLVTASGNSIRQTVVAINRAGLSQAEGVKAIQAVVQAAGKQVGGLVRMADGSIVMLGKFGGAGQPIVVISANGTAAFGTATVRTTIDAAGQIVTAVTNIVLP